MIGLTTNAEDDMHDDAASTVVVPGRPLPNGLSQPDGHPLGAQAGEAAIRQ